MNLRPKVIIQIANYGIIFTALTFLMLIPFAVYFGLQAPEDYLQGVYYKIMFIHVPSAWLAMVYYMILTFFSILFLVYKNPSFDLICKAVAPIGLISSVCTLVTGSLWAKPTWGTWWVWDARLTSMLILMLIYLAYQSIRNIEAEPVKVSKVAAVFAIIGLINIPVIKFSVDIWSTLHQGASVIRTGGSSIHPTMLKPLILSAFALFCFSFNIAFLRIATIIGGKINK